MTLGIRDRDYEEIDDDDDDDEEVIVSSRSHSRSCSRNSNRNRNNNSINNINNSNHSNNSHNGGSSGGRYGSVGVSDGVPRHVSIGGSVSGMNSSNLVPSSRSVPGSSNSSSTGSDRPTSSSPSPITAGTATPRSHSSGGGGGVGVGVGGAVGGAVGGGLVGIIHHGSSSSHGNGGIGTIHSVGNGIGIGSYLHHHHNQHTIHHNNYTNVNTHHTHLNHHPLHNEMDSSNHGSQSSRGGGVGVGVGTNGGMNGGYSYYHHRRKYIHKVVQEKEEEETNHVVNTNYLVSFLFFICGLCIATIARYFVNVTTQSSFFSSSSYSSNALGDDDSVPNAYGFAGGGGGSSTGEGDEEFSLRYRPCIVARAPPYRWNQPDRRNPKTVHMIQTSYGDPSHQWSRVPCFVSTDDPSNNNNNNNNHHNGGTGGNGGGGGGGGVSHNGDMTFYGTAAFIEVSFASGGEQGTSDSDSGSPFEDRPPILGFGGAFTEAAALNYLSLMPAGKDALLELLFGASGLGYTLGRVHMNSCDFCVNSYSFDETDGDFDLHDFDTMVTHDVKTGMIAMMKDANERLLEGWPDSSRDHYDQYQKKKNKKKNHNNNNNNNNNDSNNNNNGGTKPHSGIAIIATPWSPPAWMKQPYEWQIEWENQTHATSMHGSVTPTCLRDGTGPNSKYARAWANYFAKFIQAYKDQGVDIWGVTIQNDPLFAAPAEACCYTVDDEGRFLANHLGPILRSEHPEVKLFVFDHDKDMAPQWGTTLMDEQHPAFPYIDGLAYHWYSDDVDRQLDGSNGTPNLHQLLEQTPSSKLLINSEASNCPTTGYATSDLYKSWLRAQRYAHDILADLASGGNGWIEWNLILDSIGGPNHANNMCDATVLAVPHRAKDAIGIPIYLDWENGGETYGPPLGNSRTRDELDAMGMPAKYLDVGIVVQPMYYYMGHISRYVRPGSRTMRALVDGVVNLPRSFSSSSLSSSYNNNNGGGDGNDHDEGPPERIFRPYGKTVAGGGTNDKAQNGIEVTLWPCEGSTRQKWIRASNNQLQVDGRKHATTSSPQKYYSTWTSATFCLGRHADPYYGGLLLTYCNTAGGGDPGSFQFIAVDDTATNNRKNTNSNNNNNNRNRNRNINNNGGVNSKLVNIRLTGEDTDPNQRCLRVQPLKNNGGAYGERGGAQVTIGNCDDPRAYWKFDARTGEIISEWFEGGEVCMTTGWPFLQVGAFTTPESKHGGKTILVINEAGEPASYQIYADHELLLTASIPANSIQTIAYD